MPDKNGTLNYLSKRFWLDFAERVGWTLAQVGLGLVSVEAFDLPPWAVIPIATGLAVVKGFVAKQLGDAGSASTIPSAQHI